MILIATTNAGKIAIYSKVLNDLQLEWCDLNAFKNIVAPEETGTTAIENAIIKAQYYHQKTGIPVIANDSALIIHKLKSKEQPGVTVRRVNGKELTDEEMIEHYSRELNKVGGKSKAHYDVGLAIVDNNGTLKYKLFKPKRLYLAKGSAVIRKGFPLDSLAYSKKFKKFQSEMTPAERNEGEGRAFAMQAKFIKNCFKTKQA